MAANQEYLISAFKKISPIKKSLYSKPNFGKLTVASVEDYHSAIQAQLGIKIAKKSVRVDSRVIRGFVNRFEKGGRIYIEEQQPHDWKRFTAAALMSYIVLDEPHYHSRTLYVDCKSNLNLIGVPAELKVATSHRASLAYSAAVEIMYPLEWRKLDTEYLFNDVLTLAEIAQGHELPLTVIKAALNRDYIRACEMAWNTICT